MKTITLNAFQNANYRLYRLAVYYGNIDSLEYFHQHFDQEEIHKAFGWSNVLYYANIKTIRYLLSNIEKSLFREDFIRSGYRAIFARSTIKEAIKKSELYNQMFPDDIVEAIRASKYRSIYKYSFIRYLHTLVSVDTLKKIFIEDESRYEPSIRIAELNYRVFGHDANLNAFRADHYAAYRYADTVSLYTFYDKVFGFNECKDAFDRYGENSKRWILTQSTDRADPNGVNAYLRSYFG